jgi:hypothetical protein
MIEVELLEGIVGSYVGSYVVFIFQLAESAHPFCGGLSIPSQRCGIWIMFGLNIIDLLEENSKR